MEVQRIKEGDYVILHGGGVKRMAQVKRMGAKLRLGRSGAADMLSLVGMRVDEVVQLEGNGRFVPTKDYPDLDLSTLNDQPRAAGAEQQQQQQDDDASGRDNRSLMDDNQSQGLTNTEVAQIRRDGGLDVLLSTLVERSTTFQSKTNFSQEKYLRKKQKKYGTIFKVEKVFPDNLAEVHLPTINPSDHAPDDSKFIRLRADSVALMLHHGDVKYNSRVLCYERTNGVLCADILTRLNEDGRLYQVMEKRAQPNPVTAMAMQLDGIKTRWKAVPRNAGFVSGAVEEVAEVVMPTGPSPRAARAPEGGVSQWMKGLDARAELLANPADSLIIADDEDTCGVVADLLPFLAVGGHVVVFSPFLEDCTALFEPLRRVCVNVRIMQTWYRHHQVLPQRTHPTVNMSSAGGYILTAVKVAEKPQAPVLDEDGGEKVGQKRARDDAENADE